MMPSSRDRKKYHYHCSLERRQARPQVDLVLNTEGYDEAPCVKKSPASHLKKSFV